MQLDLTDEETFAILNLLTETIEADGYPLSPPHPNAAEHPREVSADGTDTATAAPGRQPQMSATLTDDRTSSVGDVR